MKNRLVDSINSSLKSSSARKLYLCKLKARCSITWFCLCCGVSVCATTNAQTLHQTVSFEQQDSSKQRLLTLSNTIAIAIQNDEWQQKSLAIENGLYALSEGAGALPDPSVSVSLLNVPTNGFAFDQEPMTQFKVGASQQFERGQTRQLTQEKYIIAAQEQPFLRDNRKAQVALNAENLWLDAFHAHASYKLVEETRPLFSKLEDIVSASYASSIRGQGQQDIIRAELELIRLQDRLLALNSQKQVALNALSKYLFYSQSPNDYKIAEHANTRFTLPNSLDEIASSDMARISVLQNQNTGAVFEFLQQHSLVLATEQRVKALELDTKIAEESLSPQYSINASYAYRDDTPMGDSRADFFSVGLSMSMPLFSSSKQDAQITNTVQRSEALKTEKRLQLRELYSGVKAAYAEYLGVLARIDIYEQKIIPQMKYHSDATLNAYTNDTGDFAQVVRAKIDELDAALTLLKLQVAKHRAIASIRYYLPASVFDTEQFDKKQSSHKHLNKSPFRVDDSNDQLLSRNEDHKAFSNNKDIVKAGQIK